MVEPSVHELDRPPLQVLFNALVESLAINDVSSIYGFGSSFDGSNAGQSTFQFRDMTSQDVKLGVRWTCCDAPPPPVLVTKG